ncbi:MAG: hypothetical protein HDT39_09300 [Lachnospiraceae bacterium]|nr:hypothetical protein [Lachnospiraceae bacterium]
MTRVQEGATIGNRVSILRMSQEDMIKEILELENGGEKCGNGNGSNTLNAKINQAIVAQKKAQDISKDYGGKSVASDGEINTLSGWGKYKDPNNIINRSVAPQDVIAKSKEIGHELQQNSFLDNINRGGEPGQSKASHAEKQLSLISTKPIGVAPIDMCDDCIIFFSKLSVYEKRTIIVADPSTVRIFESDGSVREIKR